MFASIIFALLLGCVSGNVINNDKIQYFHKINLAEQIPKNPNDESTKFNFINRSINSHENDYQHAELYLNFTEMVTLNKFPVQEHTVTTDDGYEMTIFRIPGRGPPVLMQHGMMSCADDLVTGGVDGALPYFAAKEGYDVWVGSTRGSKYGMKHKKHTSKSREFWNFSWHEIGVFDLPAIVDYILAVTKKKSINYVGHSQGTTTFLVMCAERPEYNKKINLAILLATEAYMYHIENELYRLTAELIVESYPILDTLGIDYVSLNSGPFKTLFKIFCLIDNSTICHRFSLLELGVLGPLGQLNLGQVNIERLPVQLAHAFTPSSLKQVVHYAQQVLTDDFRQFDEGYLSNLGFHGTVSPPSYPLERIDARVAMFHGQSDEFSNIQDVKKTRNKLLNVVDFYVVPYKPFDHFDFVWSKDIKALVYSRISQLLKQYN